jgi:OPT family oligopeptide transporter
MGTSTSLHMLFGAVLGWVILSPLAKKNNWAPGPVGSWEDGSKGWILWISLAIMLADAVVNLGWLILKAIVNFAPTSKCKNPFSFRSGSCMNIFSLSNRNDYSALPAHSNSVAEFPSADHSLVMAGTKEDPEAPSSQLISSRTVLILLPITLALNVVCMHIVFGNIIHPLLSCVATVIAVVLSVMGVRALGETDLNPVSGISKLTQLIFAIITPTSHFSRRSAVITNLVAGAVSEAGALQAGDMMQDLKTGHILGASPKAQFYGQLIGSVFGAVIATAVYRLYVSVYEVPSDMFQIPSAYVWISTARLVTGDGLPPMAWQASIIAGAIFTVTTIVRIVADSRASPGGSPPGWKALIPGGIAVAVGMFNVPSFTLARVIGGMIVWWYSRTRVSSSPPRVLLWSFFRPSIAPVDQDNHEITASTPNDHSTEAHHDNHDATLASTRPGTSASIDRFNEDHGSHGEQRQDSMSSTVVVLASGLILGEGILSIVNLGLANAKVPHL